MYKPYYNKNRAQKRMDGEDVYGQKISVSYPRPLAWEKPHSPIKNLSLCGILPITTPPQTLPPNPQETWYHSINNGSNIRTAFFPELHGQIKEQSVQNNILQTMKNSSETAGRYIRGRHSYQLQTENWHTYNITSRAAPYPGRPITKIPVEQAHPHSGAIKRCRTPNTFLTSAQKNQNLEMINGSAIVRNQNSENTFQPIQSFNKDFTGIDSVINNTNIDLMVMNLDNSIHPREMRNILLNLFNERVKVLQLSVHTQSDGNMVALVKIGSIQDAQYVISMLHRRRIGSKRIIISYANSGSPNLHQLRAQVIALLQDVPVKKLPLFRFCELFETRYHTSVSISDLYKLRDVCAVSEDSSGRMIALCDDALSSTPSPILNTQEINTLELLPYCQKHVTSDIAKGWAELDVPELPNIRIGLKLFTARLHSLMHSHNGMLHLQSLPTCYEYEMKEKMPIDESGVPLEHLVTCVSSVELRQGTVKLIVWNSDSTSDQITDDSSTASGPCGGKSTPLATQMALFSRELIELLRTIPHCRLLFTKFIPAYHHHFGRQCRVADYGFTKLIDLFESLSHIVQVIGEGNQRMLTLSHRAQISRFTSDLLRILKTSTSRQVTINDFPSAAEKVLSRPWDPTDYGVCELGDLLAAMPDHTVVISGTGENIVISLPKREQTPEEIVKTKQFAVEVVELLKHSPQCSILFNKFVPAYHHHFGHQCRVSDYGFTKLIELFESIPEVVKIEDASNGERMIRLTKEKYLKVIGSQIASLIISKNSNKIPLAVVSSAYMKEHGYALQPESYGFSSIEEIVNNLDDCVTLTLGLNNMLMVELIDRSVLHSLGLRIWKLMLNTPNYNISTSSLLQAYQLTYNDFCELKMLKKLAKIVQIISISNDETVTELTTLYIFAAQSYAVLYELPNGLTTLFSFEQLFFQKHGFPIQPATIGFPTLEALISALPDILVLTGLKTKQVMLNRNLAGVGVPLPYSEINSALNSGVQYSYSKHVKTKRPNSASNQKSVFTNNSEYSKNLGQNIQQSLWSSQQNITMPSYIPPKPDTPPAQGIALWSEVWTPPDFKNNVNLSIQLPNAGTPKLPDSPCFVSPDKNLLSACFNSQGCSLQPPPPNALPKPSPEYFKNSSASKESLDQDLSIPKSIETNSFLDANDSLTFHSLTPGKCKRKVRLAAQFNSPINIS